ncbi:MAG: hypothetical protein HYU67_07170 [Flavobacteriia bacterium]|nr:hypothetical protein [Flavobacteriia bacterium]
MKKLVIFFFLIFLCQFNIYGQKKLLYDVDTLNYRSRSGSFTMDSLDYYHTSQTTLNSGGSVFHPFGRFQQCYTSFFSLLDNSFLPEQRIKVKYTVLPHLGFIYSTGSAGIQYMHTDFQHLLNKNTLLNFNYEINALGQALRNGDFKNTAIDFLILYNSLKIKNNFIFRYKQHKMSLNNGLFDTTLVNTQAYALQEVITENANSVQKKANAFNQFSYNFKRDSNYFIGITTQNEWNIRHREFKETGDINSFYSAIYIDSFETRDQYQLASISNAIGLKFENIKGIQTEILLKHTYWDLQNLSRHHDTTEWYLLGDISFNKRNFFFNANIEFNVAGALGQKKFFQELEWKRPNWKIKTAYLFQQNYLLPEQRFYFSNNFSWDKNTFSIQTHQQLFIQSEINKQKWLLIANCSWNQLLNKYFFDGVTFSNDTLNQLNFLSLSLKSSYKFSFFGVQPYLGFNYFPQNFAYAPMLDSRVRLFFNKKMFKSKKLDFLLGVDLSYITSHQLFDYQRSLGIYTLRNSNGKSNEYIGLDFFMGFELNVFRFYFKVEKIDYLWSERNQWVVSKIPIAPMLFRLGLTWDFFN